MLSKERELIWAILNIFGIHMTIVHGEIFIEQIIRKVDQFPLSIKLYE